ncbi:MAG: hypothetical protein F6K23_03000 [Okeania sp. SIO2C9]|uniref:hypothetical protein n=1 Tax=Okeania sp. SIO2C9 TaxID=2607791 RepID=UPI0013C0805B|nr:hypothetical protein [Okeania sp. SIO2C9]NEQ72131.1 hypothetical protein [Okeania sp. SIO2C9]
MKILTICNTDTLFVCGAFIKAAFQLGSHIMPGSIHIYSQVRKKEEARSKK